MTVGSRYSATATASGADPAPSYSLAANAPTRLSVNAVTGAVSGTAPENTTSFTYAVTATNAAGSATSPIESVEIDPGTTSLAMTPSTTPAVPAGGAVTFTASVTETTGGGVQSSV